MSREETFRYYHDCNNDEMFDAKQVRIDLPERARIFDSYICECCGESAAANWIRIQEGRKLCIDCYQSYDRFRV